MPDEEDPIPPGFGRVHAIALDALGRETDVYVGFDRTLGDGTKVHKNTHGGRYVDLPPGTYEVRFDQAVDYETEVHVVAGQAVHVRNGPLGRVHAIALDALGRMTDVYVGFDRTLEDGTQLHRNTHGGRYVDLPPGTYAVRFDQAVDYETEVHVVAGQAVEVRNGPLGRVQAVALDALGQMTDVYVGFDRTLEDGTKVHANTHGGRYVDLPPGTYAVRFDLAIPYETTVDVIAGQVFEVRAGSSDPAPARWSTSVDGRASWRVAGERLAVEVVMSPGEGLQVRGHVGGPTEAGRPWILSELALDGEGRGSMTTVAGLTQRSVAIDSRLAPPTADGVRSYLEALIEKNIAVTAGEYPTTNLRRAPFIVCARTRQPWPGGTLRLIGDFGTPEDGPLTVHFVRGPVGLAGDPSTAVREPATIKSFAGHWIELAIPEVEPGKYEIIAARAGDEGAAFDFEVHREGETPGLVAQTLSFIGADALTALMAGDTATDLIELGHVLSQKQGRFRYMLGSKTTEVEAEGQRERARWLVLLDGVLEDGLERAQLEIRVALAKSGESAQIMTNLDVEARFISILRVQIGEEAGEKLVKADILHDGLAAALGIHWDREDETVHVNQVFGFDLSDFAVQLFLETRKEAALVLQVGNEDDALSFRAGKVPELRFRQRETREVDGRTERYELSSSTDEDKLMTDLKIELPDLSEHVSLEASLRFDDRGLDAGDPIRDFDGRIELDHRDSKLVLEAKVRDNTFVHGRVDVDFDLGDDSFGVEFGYERRDDDEDTFDRWRAGAKARLEFLDGDLAIVGGLSGTLDRHRDTMRRFEIEGTLAWDVGTIANIELGAHARYRCEGGREPSRTFQVGAFAQAELLNVDVRLGFDYDIEADEDPVSLQLGVDVGGVFGQGLKRLGAEDEYEIDLLRHGSD